MPVHSGKTEFGFEFAAGKGIIWQCEVGSYAWTPLKDGAAPEG